MKPSFRTRRSLAVWILIAGLAGTVHAQAPSDALRVQGERVYHDVDGEGALWARGESWKARFAAAGTTFLPRFGASAPRNYPVGLRLSEVTVGGARIAFDAFVAPERAADRVTYDRGTLREVYDLTPSEMEQSFVFESLPSRGELVVRVQVTSELTRACMAERIELSNEHGRVGCSRAFALDADGVRTPLEMSLAGDELLLRVPRDVVERARLPLVVDPVYATFTVSASPGEGRVPDVSYDATTGLTAYVMEEEFTGFDHDVYITLRNEDGIDLGSNYVDMTVADWRFPKVANDNFTNQFLVVAQVGLAGQRQILSRTAGILAILGPPLVVSLGATGDNIVPDVGGDYYPGSGARFAVVWQRDVSATDSDILFATVDPATGVPGLAQYLSSSPLHADRHPSISKGTGEPANLFKGWNVAWDRQTAPANRDILGARIRFDGVVVDPPFFIDASSTDDSYPSASTSMKPLAGDDPWMVVWQRFAGPDNDDVIGAILNGTTVSATANLSHLDGADITKDQTEPSVDSNGGQFVVAYMEKTSLGLNNFDVFVSQYAFVAGSIVPTEPHVPVGTAVTADSSPEVAAYRSSAGSDRCAAITWSVTGLVTNPTGRGALYCGPIGGTVTTVCSGTSQGTACPCTTGAVGHGCASSVDPMGARLAWTGAAVVANDTFRLQATHLPATTSCLYFQGTGLGPTTLFGDGLRCATGSLIRLATKTSAAGSSSYPLSTEMPISQRGQIPATGGQRTYQVWYRNAADFCTSATFNLTNGLRVVWVP